MNKKVLFIGLAAFILLGILSVVFAVGGYLILNDDEESENEAENIAAEESDTQESNIIEEFQTEERQIEFIENVSAQYASGDAIDLDTIRVTGDISSTTDGQVMNISLDAIVNQNEDIYMELIFSSGSIFFTSFDGVEYMTNDPNEKWYIFPDTGEESDDASSDVSTLPIDQSLFDGEELLNTDGIEYFYVGLEECNSGQCHVYRVSGSPEDEFESTTIAIDAETELITKVEIEGSATSGEMNFDYDPSNKVEKPTNYEMLDDSIENLGIMLEILAPIFGEIDFSDIE